MIVNTDLGEKVRACIDLELPTTAETARGKLSTYCAKIPDEIYDLRYVSRPVVEKPSPGGGGW